MNLWWTIKSRGGVATMAVGVIAAAALATAVPALAGRGSDQRPASDQVFVTPALEDPAPVAATTEPPAPEPVIPPVQQAPAATVATVTESAPQQPAAVDPESIGTTDAQGNYTPAPPISRPGEPPVAAYTPPPPVPPMPGEPDYGQTAAVASPRS